jgi:hypothetical protein
MDRAAPPARVVGRMLRIIVGMATSPPISVNNAVIRGARMKPSATKYSNQRPNVIEAGSTPPTAIVTGPADVSIVSMEASPASPGRPTSLSSASFTPSAGLRSGTMLVGTWPNRRSCPRPRAMNQRSGLDSRKSFISESGARPSRPSAPIVTSSASTDNATSGPT